MSLEYENIRSVVDSLLQVNSTLKRKKKTVAIQQKEVFVSIINVLEQSQIRSNLMFTELKLDLSSYDEMYLQIIDNLIYLSFGTQAAELIIHYCYDRIEMDGSIPYTDIKGIEREISNPEQLWVAVKQLL